MRKEQTDNAEILQVSNGWIIYPRGRYRLNSDNTCPVAEIAVFEDWRRCEQYLFNLLGGGVDD